MRKVLLIACFIVLVASPTMAQVEISAGAGYTLPVGDTADRNVGDYLFGGSVGFYLTPRLSVGGEIYYHRLGLTEAQKDYVESEELEITKSLTNLAASVKFLITEGSISPYVKGVAGSYEYKENILYDNIHSVASDKFIGISGGLGIQFQSEGFFGAFIECMYTRVYLGDEYGDETDEYGDLIYTTLDFFDFRAGIVLKGY